MAFCARLLAFAAVTLLAAVAVARPEVRLGGTLSSGGQWGMVGLADPRATAQFRHLGGRLYVHELGWAETSPADQNRIAALFRQPPVWESALPAQQPQMTLSKWLWPHWRAKAPVTCLNGNPNALQVQHVDELTASYSYRTGAFGSPNYSSPAAAWSSKAFDDLRAGMLAGRALCLDIPPDYYFAREEAYRVWTAQAIKWASNHGVRTVVAIYPRTTSFAQDTMRLVDDIKKRGASPSIYAGDVYASSAGNLYPLGNEDDPATLTSVMLALLKKVAKWE